MLQNVSNHATVFDSQEGLYAITYKRRNDEVADVQEKNDAVVDAQKKNDASCGCTMQMRMYKRRMIKNKVQKGVVKLKYVPTKEHVEDVLTKPLSCLKFEYFQDKLGVVSKDLPRKRE